MRTDKVLAVESLDGIVNLVELDASVDEDAKVVKDQTDDLNGVLHAQGIVDKQHLVNVAEHEDGKVGRDGAGLIEAVGDLIVKRMLELCKDISAAQSQSAGGMVAKRRTITYDSRARATTAWTTAVMRNSHVHFVLGMYILGVRRTGGGSCVGKPSRWW